MVFSLKSSVATALPLRSVKVVTSLYELQMASFRLENPFPGEADISIVMLDDVRDPRWRSLGGARR